MDICETIKKLSNAARRFAADTAFDGVALSLTDFFFKIGNKS